MVAANPPRWGRALSRPGPPLMDLGIAGKVALVTASSKGLGRASAEALAAEGVGGGDHRPRRAGAGRRRRGHPGRRRRGPHRGRRCHRARKRRPGWSRRPKIAMAGWTSWWPTPAGRPPVGPWRSPTSRLPPPSTPIWSPRSGLYGRPLPWLQARRLGSDLLHHVVLHQAAPAESGAVESGPDRAVGLGEDSGGRPVPDRA